MKRRELQAILSLDNRGDNCVPSTCGSKTKRQPHVRRITVGGLQATHTRPYKGTPFTSAVRLLLCLWHLSLHFIIVPPSEKEIQRLLRFETDTESLSYNTFGQNKGLQRVIWKAVCSSCRESILLLLFVTIMSNILCYVWRQGKRGRSADKMLNNHRRSLFTAATLQPVNIFLYMCA